MYHKVQELLLYTLPKLPYPHAQFVYQLHVSNSDVFLAQTSPFNSIDLTDI